MSGNEFAVAIQSGYEQGFNDGAIKELEKIKAEISELLESSVWQYDVRKIIDNHIEELKGEQE